MLEADFKVLIKNAKILYKNILKENIPIEKAQEKLKLDIIAAIMALFPNKKIQLDSKNLHEINSLSQNIVINIDKRINTSIFSKWYKRILQLLNIDIDQSKKEIKDLSKKIHQKIEKQIRLETLQKGAKNTIASMKEYDLLENLADLTNLKKLNDKELHSLLKLVATDLLLNGLQEHKYSPTNLALMLDKNSTIKRDLMVEIIETIIKDYNDFTKTSLTKDDILKIKSAKATKQVEDFKRDAEAYSKNPIIIKLEAKMKDLRNYYFVEELAFSIAQSLEEKRNSSVLAKTAQFLSQHDKPESVEKIILAELKPSAHLLFDKLSGYKEIEEFKTKVHEMIKAGSILGFYSNPPSRGSSIHKIRQQKNRFSKVFSK